MSRPVPIVSIYCPHCHRHTSVTLAATSVLTGLLETKNVACMWERARGDLWWIGVCNYCKNPVLVHNEGDVVYPHPLPPQSDPAIPADIRSDLDEAKLCFAVGASRACCVMARRAMQSSCIDKGTSKHRLVEQLAELADKGIITRDLKDWADVVRWVGNDAAHPDSEAVAKEDAKDILDLAEQFLHVLYVTPRIARERRSKRDK